MKTFGLLGKKLSHSYSPQIHALLATPTYSLYEKSEEEVAAFIRAREFDGINVTIPYKKTVLPLMDSLSPMASRLGSVNTIVKRADGTLFGHNTDYFGFSYMVEKSGISVKGKKALVLGSGGASVTVCAVLSDMGAGEVIVISRSGEDNYENISRHADADIIANTTPVGMYPHTGASPVQLSDFPRLSGVLDLIYNPDKTALLQEAEERGIPHINGLSMLVAQGKESAEYFCEKEIPSSIIDKAVSALSKSQKNIILIGMPGCGKSTLGESIAEKTGRRFFDADKVLEEKAGKTIPEIFKESGEEGFRRLETEILSLLGKESGIVLSTGGGCVTREENYPSLHQNGVIFWIKRDINLLPKDGRPLSLTSDLQEMYKKRRPLYEKFADFAVENLYETENIEERVLSIYENSCN